MSIRERMSQFDPRNSGYSEIYIPAAIKGNLFSPQLEFPISAYMAQTFFSSSPLNLNTLAHPKIGQSGKKTLTNSRETIHTLNGIDLKAISVSDQRRFSAHCEATYDVVRGIVTATQGEPVARNIESLNTFLNDTSNLKFVTAMRNFFDSCVSAFEGQQGQILSAHYIGLLKHGFRPQQRYHPLNSIFVEEAINIYTQIASLIDSEFEHKHPRESRAFGDIFSSILVEN